MRRRSHRGRAPVRRFLPALLELLQNRETERGDASSASA
jgi:hypothetical protein